ncbi:MAG: PepSY domain-containing protein, partial [Dermatophilaceae bacterium]
MSVVDDPAHPPPTPSASSVSTASSASPGDQSDRSPNRRGGGLLRAFWRWHFYASVVVIPVLLVLAVTGLIYLFRFQLEPLLHPDLMRVDPRATAVQTYESQRLAVAQARPDDTV